MTRRFPLLFSLPLALALAPGLRAQTPAVATAFEVANFRPSPPMAPDSGAGGLQMDGAQVHVSNLTLREYVRMAYNVKFYQIVGGPDWLGTEHFDLAAKLPDGASRTQVPAMMQQLLATSFGLKTHRETRPLPAYVLTVAGGGMKIKPSGQVAADTDPNGAITSGGSGNRNGISFNLPGGGSFTLGNGALTATRVSLPQLADSLSRFLKLPVINQTGDTTGLYDFSMPVTPEEAQALLIQAALNAGVVMTPEAMRFADGVTVDSVFSGLAAVGLKLEQHPTPLDVIVIDHIDREPAGN